MLHLRTSKLPSYEVWQWIWYGICDNAAGKGGRINGKKAVWKVVFGQFKILAPSFFIENIISERATAFIIAYLTQWIKQRPSETVFVSQPAFPVYRNGYFKTWVLSANKAVNRVMGAHFFGKCTFSTPQIQVTLSIILSKFDDTHLLPCLAALDKSL